MNNILGDKTYNLIHYLTNNSNNNEILIYDFEKGWLAPLKIPASFDKKIMLNVPSYTTVNISISTVW